MSEDEYFLDVDSLNIIDAEFHEFWRKYQKYDWDFVRGVGFKVECTYRSEIMIEYSILCDWVDYDTSKVEKNSIGIIQFKALPDGFQKVSKKLIPPSDDHSTFSLFYEPIASISAVSYLFDKFINHLTSEGYKTFDISEATEKHDEKEDTQRSKSKGDDGKGERPPRQDAVEGVALALLLLEKDECHTRTDAAKKAHTTTASMRKHEYHPKVTKKLKYFRQHPDEVTRIRQKLAKKRRARKMS